MAIRINRQRLAEGIQTIAERLDRLSPGYEGPRDLQDASISAVLDVTQGGFPLTTESYTEFSATASGVDFDQVCFTTGDDERAVIRMWSIAIDNSGIAANDWDVNLRLELLGRGATTEVDVFSAYVRQVPNGADGSRRFSMHGWAFENVASNDLIGAGGVPGIRVPPNTTVRMVVENVFGQNFDIDGALFAEIAPANNLLVI